METAETYIPLWRGLTVLAYSLSQRNLRTVGGEREERVFIKCTDEARFDRDNIQSVSYFP